MNKTMSDAAKNRTSTITANGTVFKLKSPGILQHCP